MKKISAIIFVVIFASLAVIALKPHKEIIKNDKGLTMQDFLREERSVIMTVKTSEDVAKAKTVYPHIIVSNHELRKNDKKDGLWIKGKNELYFLFTFNPKN